MTINQTLLLIFIVWLTLGVGCALFLNRKPRSNRR